MASVYFKSLKIEEYKCFKGTNLFDFSTNQLRPAKWTVILGNNGTGKTTILQTIANFEPKEDYWEFESYEEEEEEVKYVYARGAERNFDSGRFEGFFFLNNNSTISEEYYKETSMYYTKGATSLELESKIGSLKIYAYGASRRIGKSSLSDKISNDSQSNLFNDTELVNAEEWLMQMDYASKKEYTKDALNRLEKIKKILVDILPDVYGFDFKTTNNLNNYVEFDTDYGKVKLNELSYGYQSMIGWVVDFAKNLFENFPNSPNPLEEPAVVLIDEIDLHLHPSWQHNIISYLDKHFPNTQFIVTSHSPLIVQAADRINLILLQKNKETESVNITNRVNVTYKGWTVEEILNELMGLEKSVSDKYLELMAEFERAIDLEDSKKAQEIYNEFDKILHPENNMRKLLRLQIPKV